MEYQVPDLIFIRPILIAFIVFLIALLFIIIFQRKKFVNLFTVIFISFMASSVSALTLISIGYIADEYNLAGDPASFYMFFVVVGLSFVNFFVYLFLEDRKDR
ncbi:hypothetical protein CR194_04315 [Salipaludibacillus keqinensis]|uniref:Uncharacterized protein n=1 Tax=Salipaludibacillus keqinensis TaxID=2045207 RepID=A0A323TIM4_9BACI|nr:hypothetical protein [Salipaludibacillus keqinensis]PYZ94761.1 hypothetical protein CR194_04315 [Salipaludibacillus keqinensis]